MIRVPNRFRLSLFALLSMVTILTFVSGARTIGKISEKPARLAGTVFDPAGAVVLNAKVSVRGSSFLKETVTNPAGQYEMELPPGIHSIVVWSTGFCSARRASFIASPETQIKFDFTLLVCPSHGEGPVSYQPFVLRSDTSEPRDFLIRFGKRTDKQDTIDFEEALTEISYYYPETKLTDRRRTKVKVEVTYDRWTISASHLVLNKRTLRMDLSGDVAILEGNHETRGQSAEVDFSLAGPVVNVTQ